MSMKKVCSGSGGAILFLGICVGFIVIVYLRTAEEETVLQVSVKQGVIAGYQLTTRKGRQISAFEGIPYAAPPTGDLRFRSPQPLDNWEGVLDAKQPGPMCLQRNVNTDEQQTSGQENCLFINVYTPYVRGHHQLPVMVFIHGGGWLAGDGSKYQPHYLLDKNVVLVTFNYRLGPLGLFHRAVSQSGTAFCSWALAANESSRHQTERLANLLHCPSQPSCDLISCLRKKDAVDITAADRPEQERSISPLMPFKPVIETGDKAFLPAHPVDLVRKDSAVPWMTGITSEEGALALSMVYPDMDAKFEDVAPVAFAYDTSPRKNEISRLIRKSYFGDRHIDNDTKTSVVNMLTDGWFLQAVDRAVSLHALRAPAPVFYYYFTYRGSVSFITLFGNATENHGVSHGDDLIYLFPSESISPGTKLTAKDERVVDIMTTVWTNFARTGNPNLSPDDAVQWRPVSSPHDKEYVQIDSEGLTPKKGLLEERANFWNSLPLKSSHSGSATSEL